MTGMSLQQYPRIDFYRKFEKKILEYIREKNFITIICNQSISYAK